MPIVTFQDWKFMFAPIISIKDNSQETYCNYINWCKRNSLEPQPKPKTNKEDK